MLLTIIKSGPSSSNTTSVREIIDSEPMWKETKVTTTIDDEAIKGILKEMGYDVAVERSAVTKAMERDYSVLMKKIDEIKAASSSVDATGFPYTTSNGPGDACH